MAGRQISRRSFLKLAVGTAVMGFVVPLASCSGGGVTGKFYNYSTRLSLLRVLEFKSDGTLVLTSEWEKEGKTNRLTGTWKEAGNRNYVASIILELRIDDNTFELSNDGSTLTCVKGTTCNGETYYKTEQTARKYGTL